MTPAEIEQESHSHSGPFPYRDIEWLRTKFMEGDVDLIPDLVWYLSYVAGYSRSASRLRERPAEELHRAVKHLRKDFWEQCPKHLGFRQFISPETTPILDAELKSADRLRIALMKVIHELE